MSTRTPIQFDNNKTLVLKIQIITSHSEFIKWSLDAGSNGNIIHRKSSTEWWRLLCHNCYDSANLLQQWPRNRFQIIKITSTEYRKCSQHCIVFWISAFTINDRVTDIDGITCIASLFNIMLTLIDIWCSLDFDIEIDMMLYKENGQNFSCWGFTCVNVSTSSLL